MTARADLPPEPGCVWLSAEFIVWAHARSSASPLPPVPEFTKPVPGFKPPAPSTRGTVKRRRST